MKLAFILWSRKETIDSCKFAFYNWQYLAKQLDCDFFIATQKPLKSSDWCSDFDFFFYEKSDWKSEWQQVVSKLKENGIVNLISVLDDFYLKNYDINALSGLIKFCTDSQVKYLSFQSYPKYSLFDKSLKNNDEIDEIDFELPYRSNLQVSLWQLDYFEEILSKSKNIWDFENISDSEIKHLYVKNRIINYFHFIEKERLNYNLLRLPASDIYRLLAKHHMSLNYMNYFALPKLALVNLLIYLLGVKGYQTLKERLRLR